MSRILSIVCLLAVVLITLPPATAAAAPPSPEFLSECERYTLPDQETYVICFPKYFWNHDLVVFAHGYEFYDPSNPLPKLGDEQWLIQLANGLTITLPDLVNALGFGFAATSYSKNGLAVQEGVAEMKDLVAAVRAKRPGQVRNVYIVGASEGGLITALSVERYAGTYKAGLALCGPVGDFQKQINYWGDFRAAFDAEFPGVMPLNAVYNAVNIPLELMADWVSPTSITQANIIAQLSDPLNAGKVAALFGLTQAPFDPAVPATIGETTLGILTYNVLATNEARVELGGIQPYDNSANLPLLAAGAQLYTAEPDAATVAAAILPYQTTGMLTRPLVTMHTLGDPIVPVWHEALYAGKVALAGASSKLTILPINRYGHCIFKPAEILFSFAMMLYQANRLPIKMSQYQAVADAVEPGAFAEFQALNAQFGDLSTTKTYLPALTR